MQHLNFAPVPHEIRAADKPTFPIWVLHLARLRNATANAYQAIAAAPIPDEQRRQVLAPAFSAKFYANSQLENALRICQLKPTKATFAAIDAELAQLAKLETPDEL